MSDILIDVYLVALYRLSIRPKSDVSNDRSVQLSDVIHDFCCKNGRHFDFLLNFYNPFIFKYHSHFGLILFVIIGNKRHLSVAFFCVIHCIFIQANTLKLSKKNAQSKFKGIFFLRHCGVC